jgi:hypothetical protein
MVVILPVTAGAGSFVHKEIITGKDLEAVDPDSLVALIYAAAGALLLPHLTMTIGSIV